MAVVGRLACASRSAVTNLVLVVSATLALGAGALALGAGARETSAARTGPRGGWQRAIPTPGLGSALNGVSCTSSADCWAVGYYEVAGGALVNQALHWNGKTWFKVTTPDPGGTTAGSDANELVAVSCAWRGSCWAVGFTRTASRVTRNEALHWNGRKWSTVPVPVPGGTARNDFSALFGIRCRRSGICLAVGASRHGAGRVAPLLNQALRWSGRRWSVVPTPDPAGTGPTAFNLLRSLTCTSAANCWAVGQASRDIATSATLNQALHWDGTKWSEVTTPNPGGTGPANASRLFAAYCTSAGNCWAVGDYGTSGSHPIELDQILHWNGHSWATVAALDSDGTGSGASDFLHGVTCTAAVNCWAVGEIGNRLVRNQALHWKGHRWSQVATPSPGGTAKGDASSLLAVRCISAALCWAVGTEAPGGLNQFNEALHWNGRLWSVG